MRSPTLRTTLARNMNNESIDEKPCSKCKAMKHIAAYYTRKGKPVSQCRACMNAYAGAYQRGAGHEKRKRYSAEYRARNSGSIARAKAATNAVAQALKRGTMVRPHCCERCQRTGKIEGAHFDYDKPLQVKWLCVSCHRLDDCETPKMEKPSMLRPMRRRKGWVAPATL